MLVGLLQRADGSKFSQLLSSSEPLKTENDDSAEDTAYWRTWPALQESSEQEPESVVHALLRAGQFDLLQEWREIHSVPEDLVQVSPISSLRSVFFFSIKQGCVFFLQIHGPAASFLFFYGADLL